jgi:hypothetical protein
LISKKGGINHYGLPNSGIFANFPGKRYDMNNEEMGFAAAKN